jgi:hypothetical protein
MKQTTPVISPEQARRIALENIMPFIREQIAAFERAAVDEATPDPDNCARITTALRKIARELEPAKAAKTRTDESPDELRIRRAFASMPYSGNANFDFAGLPEASAIAGNLERLRDVLNSHAEADNKRDAELMKYGQAVAGFGSLLRLATENAKLSIQTDEF